HDAPRTDQALTGHVESSLRVMCAADWTRPGRRRVRARRSPTLRSSAATTTAPVEGEHVHAVARRLGHGREEVGAAINGDSAEHPHRRAAHDPARGVEALDLKAHVLRVPRAFVVDIALDRWPLPATRHLPLEPEVSLEALGNIDLRRDSG